MKFKHASEVLLTTAPEVLAKTGATRLVDGLENSQMAAKVL